MLSLLLLCLAATAIVAATTSSATLLCLRLGRSMLPRRTAAARVRMLLGAALLPAILTLVVMTAALAPALGWIADHCDVAGDPHRHPHICGHHGGLLPALPLIALALLFALRLLTLWIRLLALSVSAWCTSRALIRTADGQSADGAYVLPIDSPQAFVIGFPRSRLFVTRGLLGPEGREHARAIHAHEQAHVQRSDATWRWFTSLAFAFHLPGIAMLIEKELSRAQEMAADAVAAHVVGSRETIARALLFVGRSDFRAPPWASAFGSADLELRVRALMDDAPRSEAPAAWMLAVAGAGLTLIAALDPNLVHHGIEMMLGLLTH